MGAALHVAVDGALEGFECGWLGVEEGQVIGQCGREHLPGDIDSAEVRQVVPGPGGYAAADDPQLGVQLLVPRGCRCRCVGADLDAEVADCAGRADKLNAGGCIREGDGRGTLAEGDALRLRDVDAGSRGVAEGCHCPVEEHSHIRHAFAVQRGVVSMLVCWRRRGAIRHGDGCNVAGCLQAARAGGEGLCGCDVEQG